MKPRQLTALIANSVQNLRRKYVRSRKGEIRGLLISFTQDGKTFVGSSFCHTKLDKFDRAEALFRALRNSVELDPKYEIGFRKRGAQTAKAEVAKFWERAMTFKNTKSA